MKREREIITREIEHLEPIQVGLLAGRSLYIFGGTAGRYNFMAPIGKLAPFNHSRYFLVRWREKERERKRREE